MPQPSVIITPTQADLEEIQGYKITKWRTFENYECVKCQYSTLWLRKMLKHQAEGTHPWPFPTPGSELVLSEADNETEPEY